MSTNTAKAKVVEHTAAKYDETDDPETQMSSAQVPKFRLKPKHEHGTCIK